MIQYNTNVDFGIRIVKESLTKRNDFLIYKNFLTTEIISLFYCCEKVLILMNIWMIAKNSIKNYYLNKKIFTVT